MLTNYFYVLFYFFRRISSLWITQVPFTWLILKNPQELQVHCNWTWKCSVLHLSSDSMWQEHLSYCTALYSKITDFSKATDYFSASLRVEVTEKDSNRADGVGGICRSEQTLGKKQTGSGPCVHTCTLQGTSHSQSQSGSPGFQ